MALLGMLVLLDVQYDEPWRQCINHRHLDEDLVYYQITSICK